MTTSGGTAPYSFVWSNLTFNEDVIPAVAGAYTVQVEDGNGCADSLSVTILNLAILLFIKNLLPRVHMNSALLIINFI
jgi:hypothetical protein